MRGNPVVDNAIVDALNTVLEGARDVHLVGARSDAAQERLARSLSGRLTTVDGRDLSRSRHETVVVLDAQRLGDGQALVTPEGLLTIAAVNPRYGSLLLAVAEGRRAPGTDSADLDGVCGHLEREGWEISNATPVAGPLALIPFDPARIPKTVLAYLYARHPEIELSHIKASLTWRAIVRYRTWRERLLPPRSRRGRLYERARSAIRRLVLGDR